MMDPMDNALEILEDTAPEYSGGLINHGPMAADAMIALGRPEAVRPWVEYYRRRLHRPERRDPVTASTWAESLGNRSYAGWHAFFDGVVSEKGWTEALREWLPRLSPGFAAAGAHGAIRTAHAARALTRRMTLHRVRELAAGLAYWASHYQALPGRTEEDPGSARPWRAMRLVRRLPRRHRRQYGLTGDKLARLHHFPRFAESVHLLDTSPDPGRVLSELTETFARVCLANAGDIRTTTDFTHTVTATSSVRWLLPFLDAAGAKRLLHYAWQTGAAIYSVFGSASGPAPEDADASEKISGSPTERKELVGRAIDSGDEHAIKFTEACLREYALNPKPVFLEAAGKAVQRITEMPN